MNYATSSSTRGGAAYLGKDILGSIRSVSNSQAGLEDRYEYDAFGKPYKGDLENGMSLGYTGKPYDAATGMYDYGYRDYKPENARFTTVDPVRDGANWFSYVNNDPVNWVDLWGLTASDKESDAKTGAYSNTTNKIIGAAEMFIGVAIIVGGYAATAALAPETLGASAYVGYQATITGGTSFALGLARIAGAYNDPVINDVLTVLVPPIGSTVQIVNQH
jgi:RHS repeat-associated protein